MSAQGDRTPAIRHVWRDPIIEAVRLALWRAYNRPPEMVEVARFLDRLHASGYVVVDNKAS